MKCLAMIPALPALLLAAGCTDERAQQSADSSDDGTMMAPAEAPAADGIPSSDGTLDTETEGVGSGSPTDGTDRTPAAQAD